LDISEISTSNWWGGDILLENVSIRAENWQNWIMANQLRAHDTRNQWRVKEGLHPLPFIPLPFRILSGTISQLSISVPWMSIQSSPIKVIADGIRVVVLFDPTVGDLDPNFLVQYVESQQSRPSTPVRNLTEQDAPNA